MLQLLHEIAALPTAPFCEQHVASYVRAFVAARPRLKVRRDKIGNLLIECPGTARGKRLPRWVFAAHTDHPGLRALRMVDDPTVHAAFHGWVMADYVQGANVRFYDSQGEARGTVVRVDASPADRGAKAVGVDVRVTRAIDANAPGMFDLPPAKLQGKRFMGRALDDLAGVAAAMAMLDSLARKPAKSTVAVLLTRAEEEGFIGCIGAVTSPTLLKKTDRIVAIECSAQQPYAQQGDGVIVRVGDRTSIFHSGLTRFLQTQAEALAGKDKTFKHQRALMPGGTCESTVYDAWQYIAAAVCLPLGNYHNMNRDKKKLAAEYIHIDDWTNMVKLFHQLASQGHTFADGHESLKKRLLDRYRKCQPLL